MYSANNTSGAVIANSFTNSSPFAIPIGVYIVDAYARFTPTTVSTYSLKLGINTISGAITALNYTIENTLTASILPHSMQQQPSIAGSIAIGGFNGKFIRIG